MADWHELDNGKRSFEGRLVECKGYISFIDSNRDIEMKDSCFPEILV